MNEKPVWIDYTNHRGERRWRHIEPRKIYWGRTEWHPNDQHLLHAWDLDKMCDRDYAMAGIHAWSDEKPAIRDIGPIDKRGYAKMVPSQTHTYAVLEVSQTAYDEIAVKLRTAGYSHAFDDAERAIDMHGIGLTAEPTTLLMRRTPARAPWPDFKGQPIHEGDILELLDLVDGLEILTRKKYQSGTCAWAAIDLSLRAARRAIEAHARRMVGL